MWRRSDFRKLGPWDVIMACGAIIVGAVLLIVLCSLATSCTGYQPVARPTDVELSTPATP